MAGFDDSRVCRSVEWAVEVLSKPGSAVAAYGERVGGAAPVSAQLVRVQAREVLEACLLLPAAQNLLLTGWLPGVFRVERGLAVLGLCSFLRHGMEQSLGRYGADALIYAVNWWYEGSGRSEVQLAQWCGCSQPTAHRYKRQVWAVLDTLHREMVRRLSGRFEEIFQDGVDRVA